MNETQQKIIDLISKMEQNTFLLPDSWMPEQVCMATKDMSYRSYVGNRGSDRYMQFDIKDGENSVTININNSDIRIDQSIFKKNISAGQVLGYFEDIYKEQHSFVENAEGIKKLRNEIRENRKSIKRLQEENKKLEQQIADALKLREAK